MAAANGLIDILSSCDAFDLQQPPAAIRVTGSPNSVAVT